MVKRNVLPTTCKTSFALPGVGTVLQQASICDSLTPRGPAGLLRASRWTLCAGWQGGSWRAWAVCLVIAKTPRACAGRAGPGLGVAGVGAGGAAAERGQAAGAVPAGQGRRPRCGATRVLHRQLCPLSFTKTGFWDGQLNAEKKSSCVQAPVKTCHDHCCGQQCG